MEANQAASELTEDQVLNFLVNTLDEEIDIELGENADIDSEDIWDVLVGATADEDSVSHLCEISEDSPHGNTILHHLRTKFELSELERVGKTLIQQDILELLPDRPVEVVADLHLRPYYGEEYESKDELYNSLAKAGTTTFHGYATLYARVRNKRYTLAVRRLTDGDTASSILAELLGVLDGLDLEVKAVYLDREFYDTYCLTLLAAHNYAFVMPIVKWGEKIQNELSTGWSRVIDHDLQGEIDGHTWTVDFPVYIDCTYQQGKYDEEGVARHGYAVDAPFIETPRQARKHYSRRFGIESSYRLSERSVANTTTQNPAVRFLYVLISFLLQNAWRYLHWEYVASPRRGARRLWSWRFDEFLGMVRRAAETALAVRRAVPANKPPDDRFER
ncbi:ISH3 family transposase (plasmid) [Halococcus dombrowskii]|uniref:ISH3 family transposase n=2 Tax=Halococcus dombrowskii TaxID=179637 RepID=A0AAX3ASJ0_HALDO|nr:ISH3 family transposase [Halococcus dombrowskii]UOO97065.1 ISH3 family transposase [Halococcus dombrowskii]UOO97244.1 ISH3 family transposase [Halococcus dombrowskii]UOO97401.1 ISH3 family transposase [Halococcus dombrowskii]UOO97569.1 ISH3 family transposase [Halococcus dombrowskii]